ncbi:MAG: cobyric acid synthase [Nitrospirota bacterium]|nr:MAG: cobyric acid synthase [Nitrospirota bacterium]
MSRALAIFGTGSDVGKSLITAGFGRLLFRAGIRVAPFKAQNMSLNSYVTFHGGEMGRAQVLQAQACGLAPHVDMNPVLLKPEADNKSQIIVQGKVWASQQAREYFDYRDELFEHVKNSYERLSKQYEVILIEGAGSAAELNLRDRDIVNWSVAHMAEAAVILVADIDRGGIFAQVIGTLQLLEPEERERVVGVVINKFRGDINLFQDGIGIIEARTGVPVLGVIPYLRNLDLDQEDSVEVERFRCTPFAADKINIAIILLPHMSNFTDFNQIQAESDVALRYVTNPHELHGADVVVLPGSKTTIEDLEYLKREGFREGIVNHVRRGGELVGICGGFQMLGREVTDPYGVETGGKGKGLELLNVTTTLVADKKTVQVYAHPLQPGIPSDCVVEGYEIHMGVTQGEDTRPCFRAIPHMENLTFNLPSQKQTEGDGQFDGAMSEDGLVWGTYIHGVFDQPLFRRQWLNRIRQRKGLSLVEMEVSKAVSAKVAGALDRWADHVKEHVNVDKLFSVLGSQNC